jgi:hypothetical protein
LEKIMGRPPAAGRRARERDFYRAENFFNLFFVAVARMKNKRNPIFTMVFPGQEGRRVGTLE